MAKQIQREKVIKFLLSKGFTEIPCRSGKYRQFKSNDGYTNNFYFIGKNGAVRAGKNSSSSWSITKLINFRMAKEIRERLGMVK